MQLNDEQLKQYQRDGFLLFPELFDASEIAVLQDEVERLREIESDCVFREGQKQHAENRLQDG